ncbi:hypothetical protein Dimus_015862, partial [Dionaea muscipula]
MPPLPITETPRHQPNLLLHQSPPKERRRAICPTPGNHRHPSSARLSNRDSSPPNYSTRTDHHQGEAKQHTAITAQQRAAIVDQRQGVGSSPQPPPGTPPTTVLADRCRAASSR